MRPVLTRLAIVSMLLSACFTTPAPASDEPAAPSAASIERLFREPLASDDLDLPAMFPYKNAVLMEFRFVDLERVSSSRWHAEIELVFDLGPPPPSIVGFERIRHGRYRLMLSRQDERLGLGRFTPVAAVHPLPGGA